MEEIRNNFCTICLINAIYQNPSDPTLKTNILKTITHMHIYKEIRKKITYVKELHMIIINFLILQRALSGAFNNGIMSKMLKLMEF